MADEDDGVDFYDFLDEDDTDKKTNPKGGDGKKKGFFGKLFG